MRSNRLFMRARRSSGGPIVAAVLLATGGGVLLATGGGVLLATGGGAPARAAAAGPATPAGVDNVLVVPDNSIIGAHNSPVLAQNPTRRTNLVVGDRVDVPDYTATVHVSFDGGRSWANSPLPTPGGPGEKLYAAQTAFDARGMLYVLFVTLSGPGNGPDAVWIVRSTDGGLTFSPPTRVAGADAYQRTLAVDRHTGRVFAAWLQGDADASACLLCFGKTNLPIVVTHSDDQGATWSAPVAVSEGRARVGAPVLALDDGDRGNPVVLYVDFRTDQVDWQNLEGNANSEWSLVVTRSTDNGDTFGPGQVVDSQVVAPYRFLVYLPPKPALVVKGRTAVVAWTDGRSGAPQVLASRSGDGGATWTRPAAVSTSGGAQDLPALAMAGSGRVDVLYYEGSAQGDDAHVLLASSGDGGRRFGRPVQVTTRPSNRKVGPMFTSLQRDADFGSTIALRADGPTALAAWTDTRNGTVDTARQDIYLAVVPREGGGRHVLLILLAVGGGVLAAAGITLMVIARSRMRSTAPPAE